MEESLQVGFEIWDWGRYVVRMRGREWLSMDVAPKEGDCTMEQASTFFPSPLYPFHAMSTMSINSNLTIVHNLYIPRLDRGSSFLQKSMQNAISSFLFHAIHKYTYTNKVKTITVFAGGAWDGVRSTEYWHGIRHSIPLLHKPHYCPTIITSYTHLQLFKL